MTENLTPVPQQSPIDWDRLDALFASVSEQMKETDRRMQETDRRMRETDRKMQESDREMQKTKKLVQETSRMVHETTLQMQESGKRMEKSRKETDKRIEESRKAADERMEKARRETERLINENRRQIRELNTQFLSQSGHIVEGLMEPAALNIFRRAGFDIVNCWKEMKGTSRTSGRKMEVDLFYHDTTESIAVEVKINCTKQKVDHFLEQMSHFKEVFPKYADSKVYAAIAALNYEKGADDYAAKKGLFIIRVSDNDVFTLDPAKKEEKVTF